MSVIDDVGISGSPKDRTIMSDRIVYTIRGFSKFQVPRQTYKFANWQFVKSTKTYRMFLKKDQMFVLENTLHICKLPLYQSTSLSGNLKFRKTSIR